MENIELLAIISFAFLGSIGHCIGMCGGFIVGYTTSKIKPQDSKISQTFNHFLYNIGRISAYTILGAIFGYFGSLWDVTPLSRAILFSFTGILMILMGLSFAGKLKFLTLIEYKINKHIWYKKIFTAQLNSSSPKSFYILGFLNGLLPCGLVYTMLVTAITTGTYLSGALVMFIFGVFTIPALFSFAFLVGIFTQGKFRKHMIILASIIVILFGVWTLLKAYKQYNFYKNPSTVGMKDKKSTNHCANGKCGM